MKHLRHLFIALLLLFGVTANAHDFEVDGIYYSITDETNKTVAVTYRGNSYDEYSGEYTGNVVIPESVWYNGDTYSVISIGNSAFRDCSGLTSIVIPNSVTSIGWYVFRDCSGLTSIEIPNSVTSIGEYAFNGCTSLKDLSIEDGEGNLSLGIHTYNSSGTGKGMFYDCPLEALYLGRDLSYNTSRSSGYSPFYNKLSLTSVTIGNSVTSIGDYAFYDCSGLTSIVIPNSVTSIGNDAFKGCTSLKDLRIEDGEGTLSLGYNSYSISTGKGLFYDCPLETLYLGRDLSYDTSYSYSYSPFRYIKTLTSVTIGDSVTSIGNYAFSGCTSLKYLRIEDGEGILSLGYTSYNSSATGKGLFYNCPLETLYLGRDLSYNTSRSYGYSPFNNIETLTSVTIGNSVTSIGGSAFSGCSGLTSIVIPNSVTSIGGSAFSGCSGLTSIEIPNSVTSIGESAFYSCSGLTGIEIPNSVTSIGGSAFRDCSGLTSIVIPNSVTSIGNYAFNGCTSLKDLRIEDGEGTLSLGYNFYNSSIYDRGLFYDCPLETLYLGRDWSCNTNNSYANSPFYNIKTLTSVTVGDSVTSIGWYAFKECSGLTSIEIPNSVTSIGWYAFQNCTGLTSIVIPNSVTSIGEWAFRDCSGLTSIVIPNSVTSIGEWAFRDCSGLKKVELNCATIDSWFSGNKSIEEVVIGNSVTSIGGRVFYECSGLTSVTIGNSVTRIGDYAFSGCSGLRRIAIPSSITYVGDGAFSGTEWLGSRPDGVLYIGKALYKYIGTMPSNTSIEVKEGTTQICGSAFSGRSGLTSIEIPNSVTSIGESAFYGCSGLTSIEIPNSVTSIGNSAFRDCSGLTSIVIPNSVTSIGERAFYSCSRLTSIEIPNSVTSIGESAFYGCSGLKTVINFSNLTFKKGSSGNGCIAYYADKVVNAPNGEMVGDYGFYTVDGVNYLSGYIGDDAELVLPSNYKNENYAICSAAFKKNTSITSVVIPEGVVAVGNDAFSGCTALEKIELSNSIVTIGEYAFAYCRALENLIIGENVEYIGEGAFESCTALESIRSLIPAEKLFVPGGYAFNEVDKASCVLYVPEGAVSAYQYTDGWNEFENIVDFDPNFTVTYIVDGEEYETMTVEYGKEIPLPATPEKEGYTFSGWSEVPAKMPAEDITITGSFTVNSYTVTYMLDGEIYATETVEYGSELIPITEPEAREGHTFSGWSEIPERMPAEDITVTGSFTVNSYAVTYMLDGEVYETFTVEYGAEIPAVDEPAKDGYTFSGWSEIPETMPAEDIVITGHFTSEDGETTSAKLITDNKNDIVIYNIKGERILNTENLERGLYIINGKTVYVK